MARLMADAAVEGDPALLDKSDDEKTLFVEHLRQLLELATEAEQSELRELERDLDRYRTKAGELAQRMLADEAEGEGFEFLSPASQQLSQSVRELKEGIEANLVALIQARKADLDLKLKGTEEEVRARVRTTLLVGLLFLPYSQSSSSFSPTGLCHRSRCCRVRPHRSPKAISTPSYTSLRRAGTRSGIWSSPFKQ